MGYDIWPQLFGSSGPQGTCELVLFALFELAVEPKKLEYERRMNYVCFPSSLALGLDDGRVPTFRFLL